MRGLFLGLAATAATALSTGTADAQVFRNMIANSGNGAGNAIQATNQGWPRGIGLDYGDPAFMSNKIVNSGNGIGNVIQATNSAGFPGGFPGGGFPGGYPGGGFPGGYPGGGFPGAGYGGYPGGFPQGGIPGIGGMNINVVTNSGNGIGNQILAGNGGGFLPGGLNINVVTNSGNGAGNVIGLRNR